MTPRYYLRCLAWTLVALFAAADESVTAQPENPSSSVISSLNSKRLELALPLLQKHDALSAVATRHAEWLATRQGLDFELPGGASLEEWLEETGYVAGLGTEKLGATNQEIAQLIASWLAHPEASANSLFHPEVRDVGIGIARRAGSHGEETVLAVVLATSRDDLLRSRFASLQDLTSVRAQFAEAANAARAAFDLPRLEANERLDRAAEEFASRLAALEGGVALEGGSDAAGVESKSSARRRKREHRPDLIDVVKASGYRVTYAQANELRGTVAAAEVVDAWMRNADQQANLLSRVARDVGTGAWIGTIDGAVQVIWVQVYARPGRR